MDLTGKVAVVFMRGQFGTRMYTIPNASVNVAAWTAVPVADPDPAAYPDTATYMDAVLTANNTNKQQTLAKIKNAVAAGTKVDVQDIKNPTRVYFLQVGDIPFERFDPIVH